MTEQEWLTTTTPRPLLWQWGQDGPHSRRVLLLGVACCRLIVDQLIAPQTRAVLEGLEALADTSDRKGQQRTIQRQAGRGLRWASRVAEKYRTPATAVCTLTGLDELNPFEHVVSVIRQVAEADGTLTTTDRHLVELIRDIFGNPFRPVSFSPSWRTGTAVSLARQMYEGREFSAMPILADVLQDAGCADEAILTHCRGVGPHVRGCWVVDLVLGKS